MGYLEINCRSSLGIFALSFLSLTIAKRSVSLTNIFALAFNSSGESLTWTRKRSEPKIEPWETPAKNGLHDDVCPFKTTLWSLPAS